jgi:benzoylformate decarboxylase
LYPDTETLSQAVRLIIKAEHLAILCGDDVGRCGALSQAVALAEITGAEVYSLNQSQLGFPNDHNQFIRTLNINDPKTPELLSQLDLAIIVGAPAFSQLFELPSPLLPSDAAVIHIDESSWETGKNIKTTIGMASDLELTLSALSEQVASELDEAERKQAEERRSSLTERKIVAQERQRERTAAAMSRETLGSLALMATVRQNLLGDYVVVEEATSSAGALSQAFLFSKPGSLFSNRGGALGWALPASMGIKLARPDVTVLAVVGDGAANYSIQALWTAAHYGIAVKILVCNNREYRVLKSNLARFLPNFDTEALVGMDLIDPPIDFSQLARAYGIYGDRFEGDPSSLQEVVRAWLYTDGPALLEVLVDLIPESK